LTSGRYELRPVRFFELERCGEVAHGRGVGLAPKTPFEIRNPATTQARAFSQFGLRQAGFGAVSMEEKT